jgi:hypothetical protein
MVQIASMNLPRGQAGGQLESKWYNPAAYWFAYSPIFAPWSSIRLTRRRSGLKKDKDYAGMIKKLVPLGYGRNSSMERELISAGVQAVQALTTALNEFQQALKATEQNLRRQPDHDHLSWQASAYRTAIASVKHILEEIKG